MVKIARTGISTSNGHISKPVDLSEKLKKIDYNYFSILGLGGLIIFHSAFFAHIRPLLGIFWVLEAGLFGPNMPLALLETGSSCHHSVFHELL